MRILFAGTPMAAVPTLDALIAAGHDVVAVITRPPARVGRGRALQPTDVAKSAADFDIPVLTPANLRDADFSQWLVEQHCDVAVVVAYGGMIPTSLLDVPKFGWLNLHFSVLPAWRGAAPVQAAIAAGDQFTGATVFRIDSGLDTGPILSVMTEELRPSDTTGSALRRLAESGAQLMCATLEGVQRGDLRAVPQPLDGVSRAPLITVADARIDWQAPAAVIERRVRAFTPAPGAWTNIDGQRLRIDSVHLAAPALAPPPLRIGELAGIKGEVFVGTGSSPLILGAVTPAGKTTMPAASWWNGLRRDGHRVFDNVGDSE